MDKIAVTGIGIVSPFGVGKQAFKEGLAGGKKPETQTLPAFEGTSLAGRRAGTIPGLETACRQLSRKMTKFMSPAAVIGCIAGVEAASEADITTHYDPERIGLYAATGLTATDLNMAAAMIQTCRDENGAFSPRLLGEAGLDRLNPLTAFHLLPNMPPCILSILLNIKGSNLILNPWEEQSAAAIIMAIDAIVQGAVDCALVGAADTPCAPTTMLYLQQTGSIAENEFPSPAGAYLTLEQFEKARSSNKTIYGVLHAVEIETIRQKKPSDPLSAVIGRTYAVAPPLLLAAGLLGLSEHTYLVGTRGQGIRFSFSRIDSGPLI